jgi:hypothetical protein
VGGRWRELASSFIPDYPPELLWNGRSPDQDFQPDELLYYRVPAFDEQGKVSAIDVLCPDTSVNRSKYSRPEHVLYARLPKFLDWKVAEFRVSDIPAIVEHPDPKDARKFNFRIFHDPIKEPDENYAHCEIRAFHDKGRKKRLPSLVEKLFRQILSERMKPATPVIRPFGAPRP